MKNIILVVDDDKTNLALAQKILLPQYRIAASNSGEAALKYLEHNRPDLILLDINMPDMDGFAVMEKIRAREETASIPVIFLTASGDEDDVLSAIMLGAVNYLKKPFTPQELLKRIAVGIEKK